MRESVLLGCALPTAANALINVAKVNRKSKVLVMGMGGLGYSSSFVLNYLKVKDVTCIDNNKKRLNLIKNLKNVNFKYLNKNNINNFIKNNFEKFEVIIDCTDQKT